MLPRLRFVFAAALIAALPWLLLGTGIITTTQNTPVSEHSRAGTGVAVAAGDLRDAHHMHALAYVRRSRELERLRELGSGTVSDWVVAPTGITPSDDVPAPADIPAQTPAPAIPDAAPQAQVEPVPEPTVVASLPPEPAVETPAVPEAAPEPAAAAAPPPDLATLDAEEAPQASSDVEPDLSNVDWSKVVPPLPRARTAEENRKSVNRRRIKRAYSASRAQTNPFAAQPDPFAGPPATATTFNPGRNIGVLP